MDDDSLWAAPVDRAPDGVRGVAVGVGAVTALVVLVAGHLVLVNAEGPLGDHGRVGLLVAVVLALVVGAVVGLLADVTGRRSRLGLGVLVASLAAAGFVLFPTPVDRHESFVERPNERSACTGLTFRHYPPGTMDASSTVYCVGLERSLPEG